jgi:hypothetical protein
MIDKHYGEFIPPRGRLVDIVVLVLERILGEC